MPFPRTVTTTRLMPRGSGSVALATSTTADKLAIPKNTRAIRVVGATVKHLISSGTSSTPPTLDTTNSAILQVGGEGEVLYPHNTVDTYLYFKAASSTGTLDISFYA